VLSCLDSVLFAFLRRRLASRYQARLVATPRIDDNEHLSDGGHADRHVAFLLRVIVSNRDGLLVVQGGRRIGEIDAVLLEVRRSLARVSSDVIHPLKCMHTCAYRQVLTTGMGVSLSRAASVN